MQSLLAVGKRVNWGEWKTLSAICSLVMLIPTCFLILDSSKIINPDGIEYVVIANHYLRGDFFSALNGVWSPLLSWIFVIPEAMNIDPFLFFRIFTLFVSVAIVCAWNYLFAALTLNQKQNTLIKVFSAIFIVIFCSYMTYLTPITPDALSILFGLLLIIAILKAEDKSIKSPIILGLLVGIGLYAKMYFFYFGVTIVAIYYFLRLLQNIKSKKIILRNILLTFGIIFLVVSPWALAMKYKYDKLSLTPIGGLALARQGPQNQGRGPVLLRIGLISPPYEESITAREEQTKYPVPNWSPLNSKNDMAYYLKNVLDDNAKNAIKLLGPITLLSALLLLGSYLRNRRLFNNLFKDFNHKNSYLPKALILLIFAALIYTGGYVLQHLDGGFRYVWPSYIFLVMACLVMLSWYISTSAHRRTIKIILIFISLSLISILSILPNKNTWIEYRGSVNLGKEVIAISDNIKSIDIPARSKIASDDPYLASYICYYLDLRCYGKPLESKFQQQLNQYDIDYYFQFADSTSYDFKYRSTLEVSGVKIYQIY